MAEEEGGFNGGHFMYGRWSSLFASVVVICGGAGVPYLFTLYSNEFKLRLKYSQNEVNLLSSVKDLVLNFSIFSELLAETTPTWLVLLIASLTSFIGFLMVWLSVTGRVLCASVGFMGLYLGVSTMGQTLVKAAGMKVIQENFADFEMNELSKFISGLVPMGSSALVMIFICFHGFPVKDSTILYLALVPTVAPIFFSKVLITKPEKKNLSNDLTQLLRIKQIISGIGFVILFLNLAQQLTEFSRSAYHITGCVLLAIYAIPAGLCLRQNKLVSKYGEKANEENTLKKKASTETLRQSIVSGRFLLVGVATAVGVGTSISILDNLNQLAESYGLTVNHVAVLLIYATIFVFIGKIITIHIAKVLKRRQFPISILGPIWATLIFFSLLSLSFPSKSGKSLYPSIILVGLAHGGQTQLASVALFDTYTENGHKLYKLIKFVIPFFSFLFKYTIISLNYQKKTEASESVRSLVCMGSSCFCYSFQIISIISLITLTLWICMFFKDLKTTVRSSEAEQK